MLAFNPGAAVIISRNIRTIWQLLPLPDVETRDRMAEEGLVLLNTELVDAIDFPTLLKEMAIRKSILTMFTKRFSARTGRLQPAKIS